MDIDIDDPRFALILLVLVLSAISCLILGYLLYEKHQWKNFVKEHDCVLVENRPVARRAGGMGRRMRGSSAWFQRKIYKCDDGKTYESMW